MKLLPRLSFLGTAIMLLLTSCTLEKRVYMSGYHIDSRGYNKKFKAPEENKTVTVEQQGIEIKMIEYHPVNDENITASGDNYIFPETEKKIFSEKPVNKTIEPDTTFYTKDIFSIRTKGIINKKRLLSKYSNSSPDGSVGGFVLGILGGVILFIGILTVLFANIITGVLLVLLGIALLFLGKKLGRK